MSMPRQECSFTRPSIASSRLRDANSFAKLSDKAERAYVEEQHKDAATLGHNRPCGQSEEDMLMKKNSAEHRENPSNESAHWQWNDVDVKGSLQKPGGQEHMIRSYALATTPKWGDTLPAGGLGSTGIPHSKLTPSQPSESNGRLNSRSSPRGPARMERPSSNLKNRNTRLAQSHDSGLRLVPRPGSGIRRTEWSEWAATHAEQSTEQFSLPVHGDSKEKSRNLRPSARSGRQGISGRKMLHSKTMPITPQRPRASQPPSPSTTSKQSQAHRDAAPDTTASRYARSKSLNVPSQRQRRFSGVKSAVRGDTSVRPAGGLLKRDDSPSTGSPGVRTSFPPTQYLTRTSFSLKSSRQLSMAEFSLEYWKKRNKINPGAKIFHVSMGEKVGSYAPLKDGLLARGWVENPDPESTCFNFRWVNTGVKYDLLAPFQTVNHYADQSVITTKIGLCETLQDCRWSSDVDSDSFYPRCYSLWDRDSQQMFFADFRLSAAEAILHRVAAGEDVPEPFCRFSMEMCQQRIEKSSYLKSGESDDDDDDDDVHDDWEDIENDLVAGGEEVLGLSKFDRDLARWQDILTYIDENPQIQSFENHEAKSDSPREERKDQSQEGKMRRAASPQATQASAVLAELCQVGPQCSLNKGSNIWIVKPGGKSRGRGIALFNNMQKLLAHTKTVNGAEKWVVQKYIENPLVIRQRKFDIRQWVLVTSWNPLTVWFYEECYLRFSADDYDIGDLDIFAHLSNNSISKYREVTRDDDITLAGNMWTVNEFQDHLEKHVPGATRDSWSSSIVPQMKDAVRHSLQAAKDKVSTRKNSCALYGYDFMIDTELQVWLLEINKSPTMEPSTIITERLCREVQEDTLKVMIDRGATPPVMLDDGSAGIKTFDDSPTGKWNCIVADSIQVPKPNIFPADRLICRGYELPGVDGQLGSSCNNRKLANPVTNWNPNSWSPVYT